LADKELSNMQEQIERDLKTALLAGDKETVETLKGLKSALQYDAVAKNLKAKALDDEQVQTVLAREAKKRTEAAELYKSAGETERAGKELREKEVISKYLPEQISEAEVSKIVDEEIAKIESPGIREMGRVISAVRGRTGGAAEGSLIAKLVKEKLEQS
jgi:uncharacterized protein YqeY